MTAYLKKIDPGYPGALSRTHEGGYTIKTEIAGPLTQFQYGQPVLLNNVDGTINLYDHAKAATDVFLGFTVRPFPKQGQSTIANEADPSYEGETASVLQRGYMTLLLSAGSAAVKRGDTVGVATAASGSGATAIKAGDIVAGATASDAEILAGATFNGDANPGDIVEIAYNI